MPDEKPPPPPRRLRYRGTHPRRFEQKYKELNPGHHAETVAKVRAAGKTPAGQHIPIMVAEILQVLRPAAGQRAVDATLGYGGHAEALLRRLRPGGKLLGLDHDPVELPRTVERLRGLGFGEEEFAAQRINFAGIASALGREGWADGADLLLADLGVSSMQIDNPARGFSFKLAGPLDMRMNPQRGVPAAELLRSLSVRQLEVMLEENADEPFAGLLAGHLIHKAAADTLSTTKALADAVKSALPRAVPEDERELSVRRVFQALRIAVNEEFGTLDAFLRTLPHALRSDGRVAILTFHSGEDRRVKKALQSGLREGLFQEISAEVIRPSLREIQSNPRAKSAKLRWAIRA